MPPVNHPALASAGIIVASVAVAAAVALYESPEVRRVADELRRRIAIALHSLGENLDPDRELEPRFNRPEDAEGFLQSRRNAEPGVDADEETRKRQREELMYWNALREEKARNEAEELAARQAAERQMQVQARGLTFDDFLKEDRTAERGTLVYNTGANRSPWTDDQQGLVRRRGNEGVRGLSASMIANPFADEYGIELDEHPTEEVHALSPGHDEAMSDIYDATPRDGGSTVSHTMSPLTKPIAQELLFDFDATQRENSTTADTATVDGQNLDIPQLASHNSGNIVPRQLIAAEDEPADDEFMTAGQDDRQAYASIQAWAQGSNPGFYSPLPNTPAAPLSEPELVSEGVATPAYSASLAGSGVDIADDAASSKDGNFDVMSEDSDGMATPSSWSEVGSDISENEEIPA